MKIFWGGLCKSASKGLENYLHIFQSVSIPLQGLPVESQIFFERFLKGLLYILGAAQGPQGPQETSRCKY